MAGTDKSQQMAFRPSPAVILVEPQLGENIGTAARAMANFGLWDLRLVNPRDGWPNVHAVRAASRADHVLDKTRVFETLAEAIADLDLVYATTARSRDMQKDVLGPEEATANLARHIAGGGKAGVLFGRERWGLFNDEIAVADAIVTFPVEPAFASLNIAQAVLLMSYDWRRQNEGDALPFTEPPDAASHQGRAPRPLYAPRGRARHDRVLHLARQAAEHGQQPPHRAHPGAAHGAGGADLPRRRLLDRPQASARQA